MTRLPTRYGGGELGRRRARAAALLLAPAGRGLRSTRARSSASRRSTLPDETRQDPIFLRTGGERKGRDGCRVPLPWTTEPPGFGFTDGEPVAADARRRGRSSRVEAQAARPDSTLSLYRAALGCGRGTTGSPGARARGGR